MKNTDNQFPRYFVSKRFVSVRRHNVYRISQAASWNHHKHAMCCDADCISGPGKGLRISLSAEELAKLQELTELEVGLLRLYP